MGLAAETTEALTSWTRTLNEEDALTLLDSAHAGTSVEDWAARGDSLLPQASPARRRELIRIVREELLDSRDAVIVESAWLRLFQNGSPHRRLGLLYGRLWRNRPVVLRALDEVVHPALERADRPLAPHDSDVIDADTWDRFLRSALRSDVPSEAFAKTRSTVQGALRDVGVLEITGNRERAFRVRRGRPDPLAFAWVVARELREQGEASETWATRDSFAARLFAPRSDYAAICVDAGVTAGLLRRGHLMAQSRLQLGPEMS
ncbi:MAG: hypothetical protein ABSF69_24840 [Polyangiaceae bacterium]|jgi:hypothetical protein